MSFTDQLNIQTPEQVELRFPVAGVGSRFLAILTDTLLQVGALLVLGFLLYLFGRAGSTHQAAKLSSIGEKWAIAVMVLCLFLLFWGYFSLFEAFWNGQTPGKRLLKIRVIKDSGRQISLFEALTRNLLRIVDMQLMYLVGTGTMFCNRQQKRLGDLVAGTLVVHDRVEEQPLLSRSGRTVEVAGDAVARLGRGDLHVIETFFGRVLDLSVETRAEMGRRLAVRMAERMGVEAPEHGEDERFLEAVVFVMRGQGGR